MLAAILLQFRVIGALTLRETRMTFGTSLTGYVWAIVQPVIALSFLVFIFYLVGRQSPYGTSLALFFSTGVLTLELHNKLSRSLMRAFSSNRSLLTYPVIKETDTLFARLTLIACTFVLINTIFYGALILMGLAGLPGHPDKLILAFLATCFFGLGFGTMNAVLYQKNDNWQHVEKTLSRPLFFLSGIFYIPSSLPPDAVNVIKWNPVLHLVELTREGYYTNYESDVLNIWYPLGLSAFLLTTGLFFERISRKQRV